MWSSDNSITVDDMRDAALWWEKQIETWIGCDDGAMHPLCIPGVQLIYVSDPDECVGNQPVELRAEDHWVDVVSRDRPPTKPGLAHVSYDTKTRCPYSGKVIIDPMLRGTPRKDVIRHEFGHILGLAHDDDSLDLGSIMSWRLLGVTCRVTGNDAAIIADQISENAFCRN